jgi:hypothetical protein
MRVTGLLPVNRALKFGNQDARTSTDPAVQGFIRASAALEPFFSDAPPQMVFAKNAQGPGWILSINGVKDPDGQLAVQYAAALKKAFGDEPVELTVGQPRIVPQ